MVQSKVDKASQKAHVLDQEIQTTLAKQKSKNTLALIGFILSWSILLGLAIIGIYRQNQIANQNKQHIDCIVKLLATPLPPNQTHKILSNPSSTCNINFTP